MHFSGRSFLSAVFVFLLLAYSHAQNTDPSNDTGIHPHKTYDGIRESINLGTGNVFLSVPLLTLPGRNGHNYSVSLMSNSQSWSWTPGWQNHNLGVVMTHTGGILFSPHGVVNPASNVQCLSGYSLTDENGGVHTFNGLQSDCVVTGGGPNNGQRLPQYDVLGGTDNGGEGITADINACKLTFGDGSVVPLFNNPSSGCPIIGIMGSGGHLPVLQDSNGNAISAGAYANCSSSVLCGGGDLFLNGTDTDTTGRSITLSSSNHTIQYKDSGGTLRTVTLNVQPFTLSCTLVGVQGAVQLTSTANVITSAVLPNGLTYIFHYNPCGAVDKVVYPSGGYTRYLFDYSDYMHVVPGVQGGNVTDVELTQKYVCRSASVAPGATTTGEINGQPAGNTCPGSEDLTVYHPTISGCNHSTTQVTDPLGNITQYQFINYQTCTATSETQRQIFQGSSTLLKTVQTTYVVGTTYPASRTTILPNGLQSRVEWDYWTRDLIKENREFAWGAGNYGAVARKTDYGQAYCYDKKPSETVYDGSGNQLAQTTYEFDNYTAGITASGAVQLYTPTAARCNVTAIQRWRNTDGTTLTTRMQYDDAGNVVSVKDPLLHTTTTSYADVWGNATCTPSGGSAAAYPTQVTDPAGLITKHSYNSCTGTVATSTDPNNQVTTLSYDVMDRVIQTTLPDTGQSSTCYSEVSSGGCYTNSYPLKIVSTQKISSSLNKTSTIVLDGLARVTQTQASDPDCSSGAVDKVDIAYDSNERKYTVTNPYCTTADTTYGLTTYNYDALDRATLIIPPDGTSTADNVATSYDTLPVVGNPITNCTLVKDEVGNQRRSCSDALGRLVEVDEPGSVVGATAGVGSVAISGTERSTQYTHVCGPNGQTCTDTIPDTGNVSIAVNGVVVSTSYGGTSTSASIASALTAAINGNNAYPVIASLNGSVINLTARTTGSATNYTLTGTSATTNTNFFAGTSFPATPSGPTLTGGTDGSAGNGPASINSPLVTLYTYDLLNNLTRVDQKGDQPSDSTKWRTRSFTYNSLSQLLCAANPEITPVGSNCPASATGIFPPGAVTYAYDNDGNLTTKTSPKPNQTSSSVTVQTSYSYELDNRLTQKSYSDGTPTVQYAYDAGSLTGCSTSPPGNADSYPKGRRTAMCDGSGGTSWSHDPMGRTLTEQRIINGTSAFNKNVQYAYYLDGELKKLTYPGGRVVTYTPNSAGRLISAVDSAKNWITGATYAPHGALSSITYNSGSVYGAFTYNSRLQPLQMAYNASSPPSNTGASCPPSASAASIMQRLYDFHLGSGDNGNVWVINNCKDTNRTQNYLYDSLNRITQAYTSGNSPLTTSWGEAFTIDAWGNLTNKSGVTGKTFTEAFNAAPASIKNQLNGFCNDAAGNLILNATCPTGTFTPTYSYDGENRLTSAAANYSYVYDGDGQRVKKCSNSGCTSGTLYWRGATGDPLAEFTVAGAATNTYIFFSGRRIARYDNASGNVDFYFSDHLGTADVITNSLGSVSEESDYYPYGGEIVVSGSTVNHYKFTGKERDSESGLDNFGKRYDSSSLGRFMTTDPVVITTERLMNPQQLNLYAYVANNPLRFIDPTGEILQCVGNADSQKQCFADLQQIAGDAANRLSMDAKTGVVGFDTKDLDLSKNAGAALVNDLVGSKNTFDFSVGPTIMTDKGPVRIDKISTNMANLPTFGDQPQIGNPPAGVSDILGLNLNNPNMTRVSNTNLKVAPEWTVAFHELAEAYEKIDGGKGGSYAAGHNAALQRELELRDQRPYLKEYNTGAGGPANSPNPQGGIIIKK